MALGWIMTCNTTSHTAAGLLVDWWALACLHMLLPSGGQASGILYGASVHVSELECEVRFLRRTLQVALLTFPPFYHLPPSLPKIFSFSQAPILSGITGLTARPSETLSVESLWSWKPHTLPFIRDKYSLMPLSFTLIHWEWKFISEGFSLFANQMNAQLVNGSV